MFMSILINYGFLIFDFTDYTGVRFTVHYGVIAARPPTTEREMEACRRPGLRLSEWAATMIDGRTDADPLNQTYDRFGDLGKSWLPLRLFLSIKEFSERFHEAAFKAIRIPDNSDRAHGFGIAQRSINSPIALVAVGGHCGDHGNSVR